MAFLVVFYLWRKKAISDNLIHDPIELRYIVAMVRMFFDRLLRKDQIVSQFLREGGQHAKNAWLFFEAEF